MPTERRGPAPGRTAHGAAWALTRLYSLHCLSDPRGRGPLALLFILGAPHVTTLLLSLRVPFRLPHRLQSWCSLAQLLCETPCCARPHSLRSFSRSPQSAQRLDGLLKPLPRVAFVEIHPSIDWLIGLLTAVFIPSPVPGTMNTKGMAPASRKDS